jgi:galactonate dehydratase
MSVKISKFETIRLGEYPNLLFVRLYTDAGPTGLGETEAKPRGGGPM